MDWDSSREYDSRTFSEDYNLHGASRRSDDHPSATQDEHGFLRDLGGHEGDDDDDRSIDNADMDLIEQIFEGKPPRQPTYQGRGGARRTTHQTDENSVSSMMRYMLEGSQDPVDIQESPAFDPTRLHTGSHNDRQMPLGDDANEDHLRDWSGSTPKRQMRHTGPKKTALPMSSIPMRARAGSGAGQGTPPVTFAAKITTRPIDRSHTDQQQQQPKPIFRSAMKPPNGSLGANSLLPRKLGRHIQLPSELSDDDNISDEQQSDRDLDEDDDDDKASQPSPTAINYTQDQDPPEAEDIADTVPSPTGTVPAPVPASVPGPTRFTRISKPNVSSSSSPGKNPIATIPTPQDTPQDDGNEEAQKSVKELKALLKRLGMMPLSTTLDTALEGLDGAIVKKGGLCEMMGLVQKLGAMCEKQKEVIHQMTDQIIAGETCSQQPVVDSEAEEKLQKVHRQLADVQNELEKSKTVNYELELEVDYLRQTAEEDRNNKEAAEPTTTGDNNNLVDASSQVSGSWATTEAAAVLLLSKTKPSKDADSTASPTRSSPKTAAQPSSPTLVSSAAWREHIQKIEQELAALKTALEPQRPSLITNETPLKGKAEAKEAEAKLLLKVEDLEDQLYDALLENRRLQVKIKTLARELLSTNIDLVSEDQKNQMTKHETTMLKDVMLRLGVETPQQVMSALDEIQRILQDVPRQRRFIAKAEKVIWESEIQEGTVRVQRHPQSGVGEDDLKKLKRQQQQQYQQGDVTLVMDGSDLPIKPGRTCSEGYEATLQRLREWSELLDVLNHVKFVDDFDDNATVLA
ncbi:hypothetical protein KI688_011670 [Linnemannia hyalina]|uniref:Uncharacterized protein n=1 Tax=Linnemannia hyalina TaxID=64524 RepID=A0A9P8BUB4_9FUNG|nr:hypothetical protein KI688_011670 [Linnemannia hyalina]